MPEPLLIVARLAVRGSYVLDRQEPAADSFDTVQFYLPGDGEPGFRVRTFAIDHDIHVHGFTPPQPDAQTTVLASLRRTYGDISASVHVIPLRHKDYRDLRASGVDVGEIQDASEFGFVFWNPDGGAYSTLAPPLGPGERQGWREVVYLGGVARFWLPETWHIEMHPDEGGCFWDPDGQATLRLNVLTFDTSRATGPPDVRHRLGPGEQAIDGGRLPTGCEFDVYEADDVEDGVPIRIRYWQIAQILPAQCRIYVFSYAYPAGAGPELADEIATLDREIRRMIPHPHPV